LLLLSRRFLDKAVNVCEIKTLHLSLETKPDLVCLVFRTYATQATLCPPDVASGIGFKYSLFFPCSTWTCFEFLTWNITNLTPIGKKSSDKKKYTILSCRKMDVGEYVLNIPQSQIGRAHV
jgi:hypothetical protein